MTGKLWMSMTALLLLAAVGSGRGDEVPPDQPARQATRQKFYTARNDDRKPVYYRGKTVLRRTKRDNSLARFIRPVERVNAALERATTEAVVIAAELCQDGRTDAALNLLFRLTGGEGENPAAEQSIDRLIDRTERPRPATEENGDGAVFEGIDFDALGALAGDVSQLAIPYPLMLLASACESAHADSGKGYCTYGCPEAAASRTKALKGKAASRAKAKAMVCPFVCVGEDFGCAVSCAQAKGASCPVACGKDSGCAATCCQTEKLSPARCSACTCSKTRAASTDGCTCGKSCKCCESKCACGEKCKCCESKCACGEKCKCCETKCTCGEKCKCKQAAAADCGMPIRNQSRPICATGTIIGCPVIGSCCPVASCPVPPPCCPHAESCGPMIERQALFTVGPNSIIIKVRHRPDFTFACPHLMSWLTSDPNWNQCFGTDHGCEFVGDADRTACDEVQEVIELRCTDDGETTRRRYEVRRYINGNCPTRVEGSESCNEWISRRISYNFAAPETIRERCQDVEESSLAPWPK